MDALYQALPAANSSWVAGFHGTIDRVETPHTPFVANRLAVIKLVAYSALECLVHLGTAVLKSVVTVIQLPLYPFFKSIDLKKAYVDIRTHLTHTTKLSAAMAWALAVGFVRPDYASMPYRKFSLVKRPAPPAVPKQPKTTLSERLYETALVAGAAVMVAGIGCYLYGKWKQPQSYTFCFERFGEEGRSVIPLFSTGANQQDALQYLLNYNLRELKLTYLGPMTNGSCREMYPL